MLEILNFIIIKSVFLANHAPEDADKLWTVIASIGKWVTLGITGAAGVTGAAWIGILSWKLMMTEDETLIQKYKNRRTNVITNFIWICSSTFLITLVLSIVEKFLPQ
jgi:hypothetical protein